MFNILLVRRKVQSENYMVCADFSSTIIHCQLSILDVHTAEEIAVDE